MKIAMSSAKPLKNFLMLMPFIAGTSFYSASNAIAEEPAVSASDCAAPVSDEEASEKKSRIGDIAIHIHPIFDENDPDENIWIFRTVNALHIDTKQKVIRNDLLFQKGEIADGKLIDESERRLRTRSYLSKAKIEPTNPCGDITNINVDVNEVWTLLPEFGFSQAGGKNSWDAGLRDSNFLGLGKTVNVKRTSSEERSGNSFEYIDPNTGLSNSTISLLYADNSDGVHQRFEYIRPFASLTTDWSAGIILRDFEQEDTLFDLGDEVNRFGHNNSTQSVFYGKRLGFSTRDSIHRLLVGYTKTEDEFMSVLDGEPPEPSIFVPANRQYDYGWLEYQHIDDEFIKAYNVRQINRVEDINLGTDLRFRLGHASSELERYDGAYVFEGEVQRGFSMGKRQLVLANLVTDGFYNDGEFFSGKVVATASYHWENFERGQFFIALTEGRGYSMFEEAPLELGGDTGLRGYPARYQSGDHLQLINIEQRYYGEREWFSLFHLGAAVFYDQGRAYGDNSIPATELGWLRNVGIGLRVSGTRTGNREEGAHNILHIDLGYPLDVSEAKDIDKVQLLVGVKKQF